ncbi:RagB/SusD family nutrient uptake outer membrane protein [Bacteroides helcogenes]|uniref:RagB/SusD domain protein n=1 Tax=Bacteroides helcogenes (strain ATCC 35417 / DSM 20613 / JCM 6297 / CCUG 15421 / P 36-108) TaxID=693979 RepID=E6SUX3_BACT6|nr:RagB/SusD family nutrient uptake outer membrane protein [Bacteroides helcogenes]ADV42409.1 RagB/SusD domain protein [Bacteroides helcogenes P 36-108]MDY5238087.1 RagB/SusD family nutrient uptake outer membrane protein [Bacteroides helcogenes]
MKKIYYLLLSVCLTTACQSDWLTQNPTTGGSAGEINGFVDNAKLAINGMARTMYMQMAAGTGYNGEATVMSYIGECVGRDFIYTRYESGFKNGENGVFNTQNTARWDYVPWTYYYTLIMNGNTLLENIDQAAGDDNQRKFLKAQILTFRAHAYSRLIEMYCDAWDVSNQGAADGVVLRLDTSNGSQPLSSLADCYTQVYQDLKDAINLYTESGLTLKEVYNMADVTTIQLPDAAVAHAVYARAALNKEDYATALEQAKLARTGHPLMTVAQYKSGFNAANDEWLWGAFANESDNIGYYAFQTFMAYNGSDAMNYYRAPVANRELIDDFPDTDIRKGLFIHKGIYCGEGEDAASLNFTDDANLGMFRCVNRTTLAINKEDASYPAYARTRAYAADFAEANGGYSISARIIFPYTALKFSTPSNGTAYNAGCVPFIRSSEMVLIEAEANYFLDHAEAAQANLIELNKTSGRDPEYTCTLTGEALFNEIVRYRRLELWGEGHSWFDCKRWHQPVVRTSLQNGGSFISTISGTLGANADDTFWKWIIPANETDYNEAIGK